MERDNIAADLVYSRRINLIQGNAEAVIAGLNNTFYIGCALAGLDGVLVHIGKEIGDRRVCLLGIGKSHYIPFVSRHHLVPEVHIGLIIALQGVGGPGHAGGDGAVLVNGSKAPVDHTVRDNMFFNALLDIAVCDAVLGYALGELLACSLKVILPEVLLLLLGEIGEIGIILARIKKQGKKSLASVPVLLHTLDGK